MGMHVLHQASYVDRSASLSVRFRACEPSARDKLLFDRLKAFDNRCYSAHSGGLDTIWCSSKYAPLGVSKSMMRMANTRSLG